MSKISIVDLEVHYCVGTTDEYTSAAVSDRMEKTINYYDVAQELLKFGERRSWKLIEKVSANIADFILAKFKPEAVTVQVKKFPFPQARWVSVSITRQRPQR